MRNPFDREPAGWQDYESEAAGIFTELSDEALPKAASDSIHDSMMAALRTTTRAVGTTSRFGFAGAAIVAPLLAVGAVGAAAGESPIAGTIDAIESAASALGVGGNSAETRQDLDNRNELAQDFGQPGSQPGNTANAPGLGGASSVEAAAADAPAPAAKASDSGPTAPAANEAPTAAEKPDPHDNGKGCDDVLFSQGEPPFASPGGPVGCEVGKSGEHRQNGAKQAGGEDTPDDAETPTANEEPTEDGEDSPGGTSRGLGKGHDEDKPGNGQANGHDKHDHDPNPNGKGPDKGDTTEAPAPDAPAPTGTNSDGPGNSGGKKPENPGNKNK